ncbi:hypothetical protein ACEWY4_025455 [Coilia grayii]|uniref:BZIP domain-containing protein n=1 Tax=Coilia grayii TaxID=363190 RepID=A0ABD1IZC1_9TELE
MPGVFMDTTILAESFASFSGEESQSSPDWGKDAIGPNRGKRKEKNRDAARKSRKKQTERADLLHEELQFLERSNAAFEKEIADLKAELKRYTTALQQHEPQCSLHSSSKPACHATPQLKAFSFTSTSTSTLAVNIDPMPVAGASLATRHGDALSDLSLTELLDSTDWTPTSSELWNLL